MMKPKHIPIRTCVACRTSDAKRGLLRVVRLADSSVVFDPKGKIAGRGAYVCAQLACIALARKQKKLERSLKAASIADGLFEELERQISKESLAGTELPGGTSQAATVPAGAPAARSGSAGIAVDGAVEWQQGKEDAGEGCGAEPQESE